MASTKSKLFDNTFNVKDVSTKNHCQQQKSSIRNVTLNYEKEDRMF